MTKDFLWRLKLHVGNWNEWPLVLKTWISVLSGLKLDCGKAVEIYYTVKIKNK